MSTGFIKTRPVCLILALDATQSLGVWKSTKWSLTCRPKLVLVSTGVSAKVDKQFISDLITVIA